MHNLKNAYDDEFSALGEKWSEIQKVLSRAVDAIKIYVVNSKSDRLSIIKKRKTAMSLLLLLL